MRYRVAGWAILGLLVAEGWGVYFGLRSKPTMHNPSEKRKLDIPRDWQLTRRFKCPTCGKRYAVVEWKRDPICRQCGDALRAEDLDHRLEGRQERRLAVMVAVNL